MSVYEQPIPDGYTGTAETIRIMHELTADAVRDDQIIRLARDIVAQVGHKDYLNEAAAILAWCQANLRYVRDPWHPQGLERLQHPVVTIFQTRSGDCDELAPAFSALCAAIGAPWAFRTVSSDIIPPLRWKHVYSLVNVGGQWLPADPTFPNAPLGWEPSDLELRPRFGSPNSVTAKRDWPAGY